MNKIENINYQGRNIAIEDNALEYFQAYEEELKKYFLQQEAGEEIFGDIQYRMAEIMDSKLQSGQIAITLDDVKEIKTIIGDPSQFATEQESAKGAASSSQAASSKTSHHEQANKKLYRSANEKMIGGVCYGIANYFNIDPLTVRLLFVLVTLAGFGAGVVIYIVLWVILPVKHLDINLKARLFRNPKDTVIAGVCSGIAEFFSTESWIVRTIFFAPILLNILSHNYWHFAFGGGSLSGIAVVTYVVIWATTRYARTNTDMLQMQNTPVNIETMTNIQNYSLPNKNSRGINKFFKVIAYILIAFCLLVFIPSSIAMSVGSVAIYPIMSKVLSPEMQTVAISAFTFAFILPVVALGIWFVRRVGNYKSPNKNLRTIVFSLFSIGVIALFWTISYVGANFGSSVSTNEKIILQPNSDTLYIKSFDSGSIKYKQLFDLYAVNEVIKTNGDKFEVKGVRLDVEETDDTAFYYTIEKYALGKSKEKASESIEKIEFQPVVENNTLYLPHFLKVPSNETYKLQNLQVTVFVPKGKTAIVNKDLRNKLRFYLVAKPRNFHLSNKDSYDKDKVVTNDSEGVTLSSNSDEDEINITVTDDDGKKVNTKIDLQNAKIEIENAKQEASQQIEDAKRQLEDAKRNANQQIEDAKRQLEDAKREAERSLEDAKRDLENK